MAKTYSLHDLSARQTRALEGRIGRPMSKWFDDAPSDIDLITMILVEVTGDPEDKFLDMPTDDLFAMFVQADKDPNPPGPKKPE